MDIPELPDCDTPAAVLAFAQAQRAAAQRAEARLLEAALVWADLHPEESLTTPVGGGDPGPALFAEVAVPLAGEGTPLVAEFAPMELGAALGMSTDSARALVGDALELAHRLPRTWKLVRDWCSGDAQVVIRPVIDLEAHHHTDAYAVPDRLADQTRLTQPVCAFPGANAPRDAATPTTSSPTAPSWPDLQLQPRPTLQATSPGKDPHGVDLRQGRRRDLPLAVTPRVAPGEGR